MVRPAGKDRTGLVVALTLAVLGVPDEAIVDDYAKSDAAYKELADRDAMVGALSQVWPVWCFLVSKNCVQRCCRWHGTPEPAVVIGNGVNAWRWRAAACMDDWWR